MKKSLTFLSLLLVLITSSVCAQTTMKEYKAGHIFNISLPDYMSKTAGLNSAATIQFINVEKDVAGIVIEDTKEDLQLADMKYGSAKDFYDEFIKDFLKDESKRKVSTPISKKVGTTNFIETDVSYYDNDSKIEIYYFVGIVETVNAYYKVLCWGTLETKDTYKADFQKIFYSLKD